MYSINFTVVLLCCFQCCSKDFGGNDGDTDSDGTPCKPCESNCCLDDHSSMCICVILLESLSRSFCCAVFNVAARIFDSAMAIPTVMA